MNLIQEDIMHLLRFSLKLVVDKLVQNALGKELLIFVVFKNN